jgi:hypothetical protein
METDGSRRLREIADSLTEAMQIIRKVIEARGEASLHATATLEQLYRARGGLKLMAADLEGYDPRKASQ